jgi:hypothetical protein
MEQSPGSGASPGLDEPLQIVGASKTLGKMGHGDGLIGEKLVAILGILWYFTGI